MTDICGTIVVDDEQTVTPWTVTSKNGINYMKLVDSFGSTPIDGRLIRRFEQVTGVRAHRFLRRGLFFSHRDLEMCLDAFERNEEVYLYTGRGPTSEAMHLGHMVPFEFTKYLQDALQAILVVQLSDDEKFYFKDEGQSLEHYCRLSRENARDIIARGFNPAKTYIFSNTDEVGGELQRNVVRMMKATRGSTIKGIFGLTSENSNIGQLAWPIYQSVPAYSTSFPFLFGSRNVPCLVPMAIDQDPYFRLARDFVQTGPGRGLLKPPVIHSEFLVGLGGINDKMSSSTGAPSLFLTDSAETLREKITKYAFSGGGATLKQHREHGATLEVDVPYQYLLYFMEDDDELSRVAKAYSSGEMKTSEIKDLMIKVVTDFVGEHQRRRGEVSDAVLDHFFSREREFDHTRVAVENRAELLSEEQYAAMGINFDRYFGCAKQ